MINDRTPRVVTESDVAVATFLARYTGPTRKTYTAALRRFQDWFGPDILHASRADIEPRRPVPRRPTTRSDHQSPADKRSTITGPLIQRRNAPTNPTGEVEPVGTMCIYLRGSGAV